MRLEGMTIDVSERRGAAVEIDARFLSTTWLSLDGDSHDPRDLIRTRLRAGRHTLKMYGGAEVGFTVRANGVLDYEPRLEGILSGRGSRALTVWGAAVQVDATALAARFVSLDYVNFDPTQRVNLRLLPGPHVLQICDGAAIDFTITAGGAVDYAEALEDVVSGRGAGTLTVNGLAVEIDATADGSACVYLDHEVRGATSPFLATLLPGRHSVYSARKGTYHFFRVAADGRVGYDSALEGTLLGRGTRRLALA